MKKTTAALLALMSSAAAADERVFAFTADGFDDAFNAAARARKTERFVGEPECESGTPTTCKYRFTPVIQATVFAPGPQAKANEIVLTFLRPTHNIKGHSLISYRIYADVIQLLSPGADARERGAAVKELISGFHTTEKEAVEVGAVRYSLDMKRTGVRFVAKPAPDGASAPAAQPAAPPRRAKTSATR